jgi:hypothetical protein
VNPDLAELEQYNREGIRNSCPHEEPSETGYCSDCKSRLSVFDQIWFAKPESALWKKLGMGALDGVDWSAP